MHESLGDSSSEKVSVVIHKACTCLHHLEVAHILELRVLVVDLIGRCYVVVIEFECISCVLELKLVEVWIAVG